MINQECHQIPDSLPIETPEYYKFSSFKFEIVRNGMQEAESDEKDRRKKKVKKRKKNFTERSFLY